MAYFIFDLDGTLALNDPRQHFLDEENMIDQPCWRCEKSENVALDELRMGKCTSCGGKRMVRTKNWPAFFDACEEDAPHVGVVEVLKMLLAAGHECDVWSGRTETVRDKSERWFIRHDLPTSILKRMRPENDHTHDVLLKGGWLDERRAQGLPDPVMVFDDRNSVVEMWREKGLCCAQVALGDF